MKIISKEKTRTINGGCRISTMIKETSMFAFRHGMYIGRLFLSNIPKLY